MKSYELTYLISPDHTEEETKNLSEKIANFITELSGLIKTNHNPSRTKLAYLINGKREAFLNSIEFSLNPEKIKDLKNKMKMGEIIRYVIVIKAKERKAPLKKPRVAEKSKEQKVEIENMDKKIDEILQ